MQTRCWKHFEFDTRNLKFDTGRVTSARLQRSLRATFLGLAANVALVVAKLLAGILGHSQALIADAVESLADIFSSIIVWRGLVVAETPPDDDHPYGHGKAEPIAAAIVSVMLLLAAGMIAFHSLHGIIAPRVAPSRVDFDHFSRGHRREGNAVPFRAARIGNGVQFRRGNRRVASSQRRHHLGGRVSRHQHRAHRRQGLRNADNWAALAAAAVIAWNGWRLLLPAVNELMDRSPDRELVEQIRAVAGNDSRRGRRGKMFRAQDGFSIFRGHARRG